MPKRDGTGPMSRGVMAGSGLGSCAGTDEARYGAGLGFACRRGLGRGFGRSAAVAQTSKTQKEWIQEQREVLKRRLNVIDKQLENM